MNAAVQTIEVNGQSEPLEAGSVSALLQRRGIDPAGRGVAVALNGSVLRRADWPEVALRTGDRIEIVQAKQGG
jgi:sulfur carrier protein